MESGPIQFPVKIVVRSEHFDEASRQARISPGMEWIYATINGMRCFSLFTTWGAMREFLTAHSPISGGSQGLKCNASQLLQILEAVKPDGIVIDPTDFSEEEEILDAGITMAGLAVEAERERKRSGN